MATVDEDCELNGRRATDTSKSIERSLDGAAGVQHVVNEDDGLAVDAGAWNQRLFRSPQGLRGQVVAIHRGVDDCEFRVGAGDFPNAIDETTRERCATSGDACNDEVIAAAVSFDDLIGDTGQGACDVAHSPILLCRAMRDLRALRPRSLLPRLTGRSLKDLSYIHPTLLVRSRCDAFE